MIQSAYSLPDVNIVMIVSIIKVAKQKFGQNNWQSN